MPERKLEPAQKIEKVTYAVRSIKTFILEGNLKPGTELPPESEMAKQINVSKFSLREALRVLQAQGLIDITQGRRTRVADYSTEPASEIISLTLQRSQVTLAELTEARRLLESRIVRFGAQRADARHIKAMGKTIDEMEEHSDDIDACVQMDTEFHEILMDACGNKVFQIMFAPLGDLLKESRKATLGTEGGVQRAVEAHKRILYAVAEHDPDKAELCMQEHLDNAQADLRKAGITPEDLPKLPY